MSDKRSFTIAGRRITDDSPSYVIAECSHNHQGSHDLAWEMFRVAKECGADAVKLQKRSVGFYAALREKGLTEYADLREKRELDEDEYVNLYDYARLLNLAFIVTAFDVESVDFLSTMNGLGVDAIKIASGGLRNVDLLAAAASTGLPLIASTGCCEIADVDRAVWAIPLGNRVAVLQCTSAYPCRSDAMNLHTIETFRRDYPSTVVGLSSHHQGNYLEPVAYALGARIFEKHFTLSRDLGPGDHANSLDPSGLRELVSNLRAVEAAMGDGVKRFLPCEEEGRKRLDVTYNPTEQVAQAMAV